MSPRIQGRLARNAGLGVVFMIGLSGAIRSDAQERTDVRDTSLGIRGSLVIHGGGRVSATIRSEFVRLAGGKDARIVVIPSASASADKPKAAQEFLAPWRDFDIQSLVFLHAPSRSAAEDPSFGKPLQNATGVWMSGGVQSRLAERFVGTPTEKLLHQVLERGGVIGGTSAGAAVQSRVMIASGHPVARIGTGFGFLPGTIIDQHFIKRDRQPRLIGALAKYPGLVGLGIDERTAVVVQGDSIRVMGESAVVICLAAGGGKKAETMVWKTGHRDSLTALRKQAMARETTSPNEKQ